MNKKDKQKKQQDRLAQALRDNLRRRKQQPSPSPQTKAPPKNMADSEKE